MTSIRLLATVIEPARRVRLRQSLGTESRIVHEAVK